MDDLIMRGSYALDLPMRLHTCLTPQASDYVCRSPASKKILRDEQSLGKETSRIVANSVGVDGGSRV